MENWIEIKFETVLGICVSVIIIFTLVIFLTRVFGKRSFSKMSSFDFAMTVAVGSIIGGTVLSPAPNLSQGIVGLLSVYIIKLATAYLRRFKTFESMVDNTPMLLMDGETILHENLLKAKVTTADIKSKLREANISQLCQIKAVVFETTGDISVIHGESNEKINPWLMEGVKT